MHRTRQLDDINCH